MKVSGILLFILVIVLLMASYHVIEGFRGGRRGGGRTWRWQDAVVLDAVLVVLDALLDVLLLAEEVVTVDDVDSAGVEDHVQLFMIRDLITMVDGAITTMDYPTLPPICHLGYGEHDVAPDVDI